MAYFTRIFARDISKQVESRLDSGGHKETEQFCQRIGKIVPPPVAQFDYGPDQKRKFLVLKMRQVKFRKIFSCCELLKGVAGCEQSLFQNFLGSGLINCKKQASWLVVLKEDAMSQLFYLSAEQLERIKPFFPLSHGIPQVDDLKVISGIIYVIKHGLQ